MARTKNRRLRKKSRRTRKNKRRDQRRRNKKLRGGAAPAYGMIGMFKFYDSSSNPAVGNGVLSMTFGNGNSIAGASMGQFDMYGKDVSSIITSLSATAYPQYVIRVENQNDPTYYAEFLLNRQDQITATTVQNSYKLYSQGLAPITPQNIYKLYSQPTDLKGSSPNFAAPDKLKYMGTVIIYFYQNGSTLPTDAQLNPTTIIPTTTLAPTMIIPTTTLPTTTLANSYGMLGTYNSYENYRNITGVENGKLNMRFSKYFNSANMSAHDSNGKLVLLQSLYFANASPPYLVIRVEDSTNSSNYAEFLLNDYTQAVPFGDPPYYPLYNKPDNLKGATMTTIPSKVIVYYYKNGNPLPTKEELNSTTTIPTTTLAPTTTIPTTTLAPTTLAPTTQSPTTIIPTTIQAPTTLQPTITVQPVQGQSTGFYTEKAIVL